MYCWSQSDLFLNICGKCRRHQFWEFYYFCISPFSLLVAFIDTKIFICLQKYLVFIKNYGVCRNSKSVLFEINLPPACIAKYCFIRHVCILRIYHDVFSKCSLDGYDVHVSNLVIGMDRMIQKKKHCCISLL